MSEWQDISTAPKDSTPVLVYGPSDEVAWDYEGGVNCAVMRWGKYGWEAFYSGIDLLTPTHWMPLPAPPEQSA